MDNEIDEAELAHALKVGSGTDSAALPRGGCRWWAIPCDQPDREEVAMDETSDTGAVTIDCDDCAVRGPGCPDCVVSVLLGVPEMLLVDERRALEALAEAGLAPRLRLVPVHRQNDAGVA